MLHGTAAMHRDPNALGRSTMLHSIRKVQCVVKQELIIQNFVPKKNTAMAGAPEPAFEELLWTIAVARLLFGPQMNIQAPPNLTSGRQLLFGDGGDVHSSSPRRTWPLHACEL